MSSFTIHTLPNDLDFHLTTEAKRLGTSKNQLVKTLLARALGLPSEGSSNTDYQEFIGVWSEADYLQFQSSQDQNSTVDESDWK